MRRLLLILAAVCAPAQIITPSGGGGGGGSAQHNLGNQTGAVTLTASSAVSDSWTMTATGNLTFTTAGLAASGEDVFISITQDATGGRSCAAPAGFPVFFDCSKTGPNVGINQSFRWNGTSADIKAVWLTVGPGVCIEQVAPATTPPAGALYTWCDSTDHTFEVKTSTGSVLKVGSAAFLQLFDMGNCQSNTFSPSFGVTYIALNASNCNGDGQPVAALNATVTQSRLIVHGIPPAGWGVGAVDVRVHWWQNGGASDGNIQWNAQSYCLPAGASASGTPAYNAAGTVTVTQPGSGLEGEAIITAINITGCTASSPIWINVFNSLQGSGGTTSARVPNVEDIAVVYR